MKLQTEPNDGINTLSQIPVPLWLRILIDALAKMFGLILPRCVVCCVPWKSTLDG